MIDETITERILALRDEAKNCNARWFCDNRVPLILDTLAALMDASSDPATSDQLLARFTDEES